MRFVALPTVLAIVGGLCLLCFATLRALEAPPATELERKFAAAERKVSYVANKESGPVFGLLGTEKVLRVESHAILSAEDYVPMEKTVYGLQIECETADGQRLWHEELFVRSHQTKAHLVGETWSYENSFAPQMQLTDERTMVVELDNPVPKGSRLRIRTGGQPIVVRVFAQEEVSTTSELSGLARSISYLPFFHGTLAEKRAALPENWRRLPALGESGAQYHIQTVFVSPPLDVKQSLPEFAGFLVTPKRPAIVNVEGPAEVSIRVMGYCPDQTCDGASPSLAISTPVNAATPTWILKNGDSSVAIPEGPHTLVLRADNAAMVQMRTAAKHAIDPNLDVQDHEKRVSLHPHPRTHAVYLAKPGEKPIRFTVSAATSARAIRISARPLKENGHLTVRAKNPDENTLWRQEVALPVLSGEFEFLRAPGGDDEIRAPLPQTMVAVLPKEGGTIELLSTVPVVLKATTQLEDRFWPPSPPRAPYQRSQPNMVWRHVPNMEVQWYALRPTGLHKLRTQGRIWSLEETPHQRRAPEQLNLEVQGLKVEGAPQRMAFERVAEGSPWKNGYLARLASNRSYRVRIRNSLQPILRYRVGKTSKALGREVALLINGKRHGSLRIATRSGNRLLRSLPPGRHTVAISGPADTTTYLDIPVKTRWYTRRSYYELSRKEIHLRVNKQEDIAFLNIVSCFAKKEPKSAIRFAIKTDKAPYGLFQDYTPRAGTMQPFRVPVRSASILDNDRKCHPRTHTLRLGRDIPKGTVRLSIRKVGAGDTWVRFFSSSVKQSVLDTTHQWVTIDDSITEGSDGP